MKKILIIFLLINCLTTWASDKMIACRFSSEIYKDYALSLDRKFTLLNGLKGKDEFNQVLKAIIRAHEDSRDIYIQKIDEMLSNLIKEGVMDRLSSELQRSISISMIDYTYAIVGEYFLQNNLERTQLHYKNAIYEKCRSIF